MRKLSPDEKLSPTMTVEGDTVFATFAVKLGSDRNGERWGAEKYEIDFKGVSSDERLILAAKPLVINKQREFRDALPEARMAVVGKGMRVRMVLDAGRKVQTPEQRAISALSKLTSAEREAVFAALKADDEVTKKE